LQGVIDVELPDDLPRLVSLLAGNRAVLVRSHGRPVAFALDGVTGGGDVGELLWHLCGLQVIEELTLDELAAPPPPSPESISVVVCTKDRHVRLSRCLAAITRAFEAAEPRPSTVEIVVVDNAPSDAATAEVVGRHAGVRHVVEPRAGLDFARNTGWRTARGAWIAYVDDDVVVDAGWLAGLRRAVQVHPDAGMVTGLVLPFRLDTWAQRTFERNGGFRRGVRPIRHVPTGDPTNPLFPTGAGIFGAGCDMAIRRTVLEELGGFDEALDTGAPLPGGGDLDIFYRTVRAGHPLVYEPTFLAFHEHRADRRALRHQYWTWGTGFMAYVTKERRADPEMDDRFRQLLRWWWRTYTAQALAASTGRGPLPFDLAAAELLGAVRGRWGGYDRSMRQVARIRAAVGAAT
jgi:GT2 family glycosyltransferase